MRIGVTVPFSASDGPDGVPTWAQMRAFAQHAEDVGVDSLWVCDHLLSRRDDGVVEGVHESWTVLAALAASTSRIELGQLVTCASFRSPGLLAKMAVTADLVSGGRLVLGLGAGWYDAEYHAFGFPTDDRVGRLAETLRIVRPLLRGETVTFTGEYHRTREAVLLPPPARPIPILVAGNGPRMLRLTARHADAWNTAWYGMPDPRLRRRLADLDAALAADGRDPATLRRTVGMETDAAAVDPLARALEAYQKLGVDDLIVHLEPSNELTLDRLARAARSTG